VFTEDAGESGLALGVALAAGVVVADALALDWSSSKLGAAAPSREHPMRVIVVVRTMLIASVRDVSVIVGVLTFMVRDPR
jgi:hypothetical protein